MASNCLSSESKRFDYGFCRQNESECGQVQDWCPSENVTKGPVCLDGCCSSEGVGVYRIMY